MLKLFDEPKNVPKKRDLAVLAVLEKEVWNAELKKIVEFGCGKMRFSANIKHNLHHVEHIVNVDINGPTLLKNLTRVQPLSSDNLRVRESPLFLEVFEGNMLHSVKELQNADVVIALDVIQDLKHEDHKKAQENIFKFIKPKLVIVSTPNHDFFPGEVSGKQELENWTKKISFEHPNYAYDILKVGFVSQIAVFARNDIINRSLESLQNDLQPDDRPEVQYKLIYSIVYPFIIDKRTNAEKIKHKINELLENVYKYDNVYDEQRSIYRVAITRLSELCKDIVVTEDEIMKQIQAERYFRVDNDHFTVSETYLANKFNSLNEFDEDLLQFVPYQGRFDEEETTVANMNSGSLSDDEETENWD